MTIKIKAPIVMLTQDDVDIHLRHRGWLSEKQFRAVSESDWRKLMRLVREVEHYERMTGEHFFDALAALKEKGK